MAKKSEIYAADFETTVFEGQEYTEVWAAACVKLYTEDVQIYHSIGDIFDAWFRSGNNMLIYFHNLKFDGSFILDYLLRVRGFKQATKTEENHLVFMNKTEMPNKSVSYIISDMGQWYGITVKYAGRIIEFRDSLKLLPFSLKSVGKSFDTKHKKLTMDYEGFRYAGCEITPEEKQYIANDVLVLKEALEIMYAEGHKKLTIGSCCLSEYTKSIGGKQLFSETFPQVYDVKLDRAKYGYENAGEYIRRAYKGGWCYLVKGKENRVFTNGTTADVNSLYPSVMHSESGSYYPTGYPHFWSGNFIPLEAYSEVHPRAGIIPHYFFVRIRTRFYLKPGYLPFIQVKNSVLYKSTECLETSDVYNRKTGEYCRSYIDANGLEKPSLVTLTLTMTDYYLFIEHYDVEDFEILDGCWFEAQIGLFDKYINKYRKIKVESKGAKRTLAKLFLNNLYGKMATNTNSSFKITSFDGNEPLSFRTIEEHDKKPGYIPVGAAITSYARCFTIRAAQANYHGVDKPGFIYADTDSIHCDLSPEEIVNVPVHPTAFCHWKLEASWDRAWFVRAKTYIEHVVAEDLEPIDEPYYSVKCAGMPERCKKLFMHSMQGTIPTEQEVPNITPEEVEFLKTKRRLEDFTIGLLVPGKLLPRRIVGGIVLAQTTFEMRA